MLALGLDDLHTAVVSQAIRSIGDHHLSHFQGTLNGLYRLKFSLGGQELNPLCSHGFVVLHHQHKGADGATLNGRDGHDCGLLDHIQLQLNIGKLIGEKSSLFVVQLGFEFQGRGAQIDGVVGGLNQSLGQDLALISVPGDDGQT